MDAMKIALDRIQQRKLTSLYLVCLVTTLLLLVINDLIVIKSVKAPDLSK